MAKRRKPLTGVETSDIGAVIADIAGSSSKLQEHLQDVLQTGSSMSRGLTKQFKTVHSKLLAQTRQHQTSLSSLLAKKKDLTSADMNQIAALQAQIKEGRTQIDVLDRVNDRTSKLQGLMRSLKTKIEAATSVTSLLSKAWALLVGTFGNWVDLSQKWRSAMGSIAQQTGATAAQTRELAAGVGAMSGVFGRLEGDVDGINLAGQYMGELTTAWREADEVTPSFARSMLSVARGFGVGAEGAVQLRRSLDSLGIAQNEEEFQAFSTRMIDFAGAIGGNSAQMIKDWNANASAIAQFGDQGERTFRDAALQANQFGFETGKIFQMAKGFDTFGQASSRVNQLNAVLGTTISSYEMMIEQDPAKRVEMVMNAVADQGLEWKNLSRIQRMTLAEQLSLSEEEAARIFDNGENMEDIENARVAAAAAERRDARTQQQNQNMMNALLQRTSTVFETLDRAATRFWNTLAKLLAPIFGEINTGLVGMVETATQWIEQMGQDESVKKMVKDVGKFLKEGFNALVEWLPTWEEFKILAKETWDMLVVEGTKAMKVFEEVWDWIVKEKEAFDNNTGAIHGFVEAIKLMGRVVVPIFELLAPLVTSVGDALSAAAEAAEHVGLNKARGGVSAQAQRTARVSTNARSAQLDRRIRELAGQNMAPAEMTSVLWDQSVRQVERGEIGFGSLPGRGQSFGELVEERYQPIAATGASAADQPATQQTVAAPSPGSTTPGGQANLTTTVVLQVDGEPLARKTVARIVPIAMGR